MKISSANLKDQISVSFKKADQTDLLNCDRFDTKMISNYPIDSNIRPEFFFLKDDISNVNDMKIAVEKAGISFKMMMEIRNNLIEAYRDVMGAGI